MAHIPTPMDYAKEEDFAVAAAEYCDAISGSTADKENSVAALYKQLYHMCKVAEANPRTETDISRENRRLERAFKEKAKAFDAQSKVRNDLEAEKQAIKGNLDEANDRVTQLEMYMAQTTKDSQQIDLLKDDLHNKIK